MVKPRGVCFFWSQTLEDTKLPTASLSEPKKWKKKIQAWSLWPQKCLMFFFQKWKNHGALSPGRFQEVGQSKVFKPQKQLRPNSSAQLPSSFSSQACSGSSKRSKRSSVFAWINWDLVDGIFPILEELGFAACHSHGHCTAESLNVTQVFLQPIPLPIFSSQTPTNPSSQKKTQKKTNPKKNKKNKQKKNSPPFGPPGFWARAWCRSCKCCKRR